jgi:large subunit ribosomal protein L21
MSKYAVIQIVGKQYRVQVGDQITVDRVPAENDQEITVNDVLLVVDEKDVTLGKPLVDKAQVTLKLVQQQRGEKIRVATYKSKSRYRKVRGHRQAQSVFEVTAIKA